MLIVRGAKCGVAEHIHAVYSVRCAPRFVVLAVHHSSFIIHHLSPISHPSSFIPSSFSRCSRWSWSPAGRQPGRRRPVRRSTVIGRSRSGAKGRRRRPAAIVWRRWSFWWRRPRTSRRRSMPRPCGVASERGGSIRGRRRSAGRSFRLPSGCITTPKRPGTRRWPRTWAMPIPI